MPTATAIKPGIYFDMPAADYHAAPGLSRSGMDDFEVSPLRYWYKHINPDRPEDEDTKATAFGTALHMLALEPSRFEREYACELDLSSVDGLLETMDDLRQWLKDRALPATGKTKAELIARVQAHDSGAPILSVLNEAHEAENKDKSMLTVTDWDRLHSAAFHLRSEPRFQEILSDSKFEVSIFETDPATGILLKARVDCWHPELTADVKSFSQRRGKSINKCIADAIVYDRLYRQGYFYSKLRRLVEKKSFPFVLAFVESDMPHETRMVALAPTYGAEANVYWETARLRTKRLIEAFAECKKRFKDRPWREAQQVAELTDEDLPQIIWERD